MFRFKFLFLATSFFLSLPTSFASANDSQIEIKDLLKQHKSILKKCGINVKEGGKKLKFFEGSGSDDLKYNVEEPECKTKVVNGETELICSPNGAKDQQIRFRSATLKVKFNKDGDFKEAFTSRYVDGGFAGTMGSSPFQAYICDESGETTAKTPNKVSDTKSKPEERDEDSRDED